MAIYKEVKGASLKESIQGIKEIRRIKEEAVKGIRDIKKTAIKEITQIKNRV